MDLFDLRTMLAAVERMPRPRRFLTTTFFGAEPIVAPTEHIDIDIIKGNRRMAPFVMPNRPGSVVKRSGSVMRSYKPAYVKPKMPTRAGHLLSRQAGENVYSTRTPLDRAGDQLGRDMQDLDDRISRREEWMIARALTTGQVHVIGDGVNDIIDYQMDAENLVTEATLWTAAGADPIADLRKYKRRVSKKSGRTANACVMSAEAADAFLSNEKVLEKLNTRRVDMGMIKPEQLPDGVTYLGYINDPGLDLYSYDEWFTPDSDSEEDESLLDDEPMIPAGGLIVGTTSSRNSMLYGAIEDVEAIEGGLFDVDRYPKSWTEKDPGVRWLMMQSAPIPGFHEPDAFVYAKVI